MACLLSCFGRRRQKSQTSIEEYNMEERKISKTRLFADSSKKKYGEAENSASDQDIKVNGNEEKVEAEKLTIDQAIEDVGNEEKNAETEDKGNEVNANEEKQKAKIREELEEAAAKEEEKLGLVDEEMSNLSGRYARYGYLGDPEYAPPSRPVEVRTSKIIVNPFASLGNEIRLVEKKANAMGTNRLGLVDEEMPNLLGRFARCGDEYAPPSRPVEVDTMFQVRTPKIIVNPFATLGNEIRLVEKKVDADRPVKNFLHELFTPVKEMDTVFKVRASKINGYPGDEFRLVDTDGPDRTMKNFLYELFTPVKEPRRSWKRRV